MENKDLDIAQFRLNNEDLSLVIVKNEKVIFETKKPGINGLLQAIETLDKNLVKSSVADKIVGVAAAMLCVYTGVSSVFAMTISGPGIKVLKDNKIAYLFENKVSNIMDRSKTDVCPFEKQAIASINSEEAYVKLKTLADQMMKNFETTNC
jgi:hypothetical protein